MKLTKYDLNWVLRHVPKNLITIIEKTPNIFIAGGFIRSCVANEKINDIDLFVSSNKEGAALAFELNNHEMHSIHETDNAFTITKYKPSIQIIHRWVFDCPEKLIESFDFTIAKSVVFYKDGQWDSLCDESFYPDLAAKRLVYTSPQREEEAGGSMLRVLKFYQNGYRIPLDSLSSVITRLISKIDFKSCKRDNPKDTDFQLSKVICGLLRSVDPNVDPTHEAHLPSKGE